MNRSTTLVRSAGILTARSYQRSLLHTRSTASRMTTAMLKHQSPALDLSIFQQRVKYSTGAPKAVLPPKYASAVRKIFKWFLPQYQGQSIGKTVYKACSTYPDFKEFWVDECQLPETFQTWFSTTSLYVWMAMVRIRADPGAKHYNQGLVDHFFRDTEERIRASGIKSSRIVNDTLKDLVSSFKGTVMSLDEGFARSDAVLAAAIWRNLVPVDEAVLPIDAVTKYVRRQLQRLDKCDIAELSSGNFVFEPIDFKALNKSD